MLRVGMQRERSELTGSSWETGDVFSRNQMASTEVSWSRLRCSVWLLRIVDISEKHRLHISVSSGYLSTNPEKKYLKIHTTNDSVQVLRVFSTVSNCNTLYSFQRCHYRGKVSVALTLAQIGFLTVSSFSFCRLYLNVFIRHLMNPYFSAVRHWNICQCS